MPEAYKKLYQGQPAAGPATFYTTPSTAGSSVIVKAIRIVNSTASAVTIKLYNDGTTDPFCILPTTSIDAGGFAEFDGTLTLGPSSTLGAQVSTGSTLTVTVYGVEVT